MRLYLATVLRATRYNPSYGSTPEQFVFLAPDEDGRVKVYEAPTVDELIAKVKKDHQVWGQTPLDYALPPQNALEFLLMERYLKSMGFPAHKITDLFSLSKPD